MIIAWIAYPRLLAATATALGLMLAAIATGGLIALVDDAAWTVALHVAAAGASLAASLVALVLSFRGEPVPLGPWRDYVTLTKPRIMSLLLITGAAGMFVGAEGWPGGWLLLTTMTGLALACGGSSALNHVMDADIDKLMGERTAARPVASGRVAAPRALEFGVVLMALSFALLATTVNVLTAALALVGGLFYVVVYTGYLKRSTDQNIVIGGAAGAVPPLVGFAAASGNLTLPALWLFLIVFLWTPPHFWALALMIKEHYAAASVPMLPGTQGRPRDDAADPALLDRDGRVHGRGRLVARPGLHRRRSAPRRVLPPARLAAPPRHLPSPRRSCCSTTRSRTWRCSSWRPRSTRCSSKSPAYALRLRVSPDGGRARSVAMPTYGLCDMPASPSSQRALPRCFPAPPSRREKRHSLRLRA